MRGLMAMATLALGLVVTACHIDGEWIHAGSLGGGGFRG